MKRIHRAFRAQYEAGPVVLYLDDLEALQAMLAGDGEKSSDLPPIQVNVNHPDRSSLELTHEFPTFEEMREPVGERLQRAFVIASDGGDGKVLVMYSPVLGLSVDAVGDAVELRFRRIKELLRQRRRWFAPFLRFPVWFFLAVVLLLDCWDRPEVVLVSPLHWLFALLTLTLAAGGAAWSAGGSSKLWLVRRSERSRRWTTDLRDMRVQFVPALVVGIITVVLTALVARSCGP